MIFEEILDVVKVGSIVKLIIAAVSSQNYWCLIMHELPYNLFMYSKEIKP